MPKGKDGYNDMYQQVIITLTEGSSPDSVHFQNDLDIYKAGFQGRVGDALERHYFSPQIYVYSLLDFMNGDFYLIGHKLFICRIQHRQVYLFQISPDFERSAKH